MKVEEIVNGAAKYIADKIYPTMTDWQRFIAIDVVTRTINVAENKKETILSNALIRALGYVDANGEVDAENILERLKGFIREKGGKWKVKLPLMPTLIFEEKDVDDLLDYIRKYKGDYNAQY